MPTVPPLAQGDVVELDVHGVALEGPGVARHQGFVIFVPYAAPGDRVRARIARVRPRYAEAELLEVLSPGPGRVAPRCPVFARCGGCALQHLRYEEQLAVKRRWVEDALERIGGLRDVPVEPVVPADPPWLYRNKAVIPLRQEGDRVRLGFYARGSHRLVPLPEEGCAIQHPRIQQAAAAVEAWLAGPGRGVPAFDPDRGRGVLRHLVVRVGWRSGEVLVGIVATRPFPGHEDLVGTLVERVPGLVGVVLNLNRQWINAILGSEQRVLWGRDHLLDELGGLRFRVSLASFFQVNPAQAERLYARALDEALSEEGGWVVDAYSGTGTLALLAAHRLAGRGRVTAVEVDPAAVADARANARLNGIAGVEFVQAPAERALPALATRGERPAAVILDPPRKGCAPEVLDACLALRPERIVYVSCNPATLARDLARLAAGGYRPRRVVAFDMFPQTAHVEVLAALRSDAA